MTTTRRPAPRIHHTIRCPRQAPQLQTLRTTPNGDALEVTVCSHCDGDDLVERMREQARHDDGGGAA